MGRDEKRRNKEMAGTLDETLEMVRQAGGTAIPAHLDFEDLDFDKRHIVRQAEEAFGAPADILVNNAAAPREFDEHGFIPFAEMPARLLPPHHRGQRMGCVGTWRGR